MEYIENKALYEHLTHYPINTTILYNALPTQDRSNPDLPRRFTQITNGDVIYHNLMSIRPNVDMVLYNNSRTDDSRMDTNESHLYYKSGTNIQ